MVRERGLDGQNLYGFQWFSLHFFIQCPPSWVAELVWTIGIPCYPEAGMPLHWKIFNFMCLLFPKMYLWLLTVDIGIAPRMQRASLANMQNASACEQPGASLSITIHPPGGSLVSKSLGEFPVTFGANPQPTGGESFCRFFWWKPRRSKIWSSTAWRWASSADRCSWWMAELPFFFPVRIRSSLLIPVPQCEATPMLSSAFAAQTYLWLWENHHLVEMELNQFIPFARGINRCCPAFFNANGPAVKDELMMGIMPPECGKILELLGHVGIWMGQTGFSMWVCHGVSNNGGWPPPKLPFWI